MRRPFFIFNLVLGFVLSWNAFCAAEGVVVIPLLGDEPVGNATVEDVLEGKTFSNADAIGLVGTLSAGGSVCTGTMHGTRWCDQGDGTVLDMTTGLVWLKYANWGGLRPWRSDNASHVDAHTRAGSLSDGELLDILVFLLDGSVVGDWRLPTKTELLGITTGNESVSSAHPGAFKYVVPGLYWSSTSRSGNTIHAWVVHLVNGLPAYVSKSVGYYVWPVRGGQ